ncbi:transmembrane amino acid transporter protein-domain-containing protein [Mycena floridula]|nr:transmembrane amino acid transporter protein-domain-containing protein [Mycena floridula]
MSLPGSFVVGSVASSARGSVADAIESYRRSQYLAAESAVASASDSSDFAAEDEESCFGAEIEEDDLLTPRPQTTDHSEFVSQLDWDDENDEPDVGSSGPLVAPSSPFLIPSFRGDGNTNENTPLIRKVSFASSSRPRYQTMGPVAKHKVSKGSLSNIPRAIPRRESGSNLRPPAIHGGQSTFGQTLFNSIAILLGIGLLSEPLAFSCAGWFTGTILLSFYGFISCYTAKILAKIILSDPRLRTYSDIGRKAFGQQSTVFIGNILRSDFGLLTCSIQGLVFCMELFAVSVILITLYADSLHSLIPTYSSDTYKVFGLICLIPTVFLPLSLLSSLSILGIISTLLIVMVVCVDGLSKTDSPGSLWAPAETSFGVGSFRSLGLSFGLFMAGYSGHAILPSLARDMKDPSQFNKMIEWAFIVATFVYALIGFAGYLMFGDEVSDEISIDLLNTSGYNPTLNRAALWMLVISPLSKFALTTQPLNTTIEILVGLDLAQDGTEGLTRKLAIPFSCTQISLKQILRILQRVGVTLLAVIVSIAVPEFSAMMGFLGSFCAFVICIIGPLAVAKMEGDLGRFGDTVLVIAIVMAIWGTVAAFL